MDSTIYFFAGSAVCVKVIPVFAVMSSSCGIGRPLHLAAFAPAGGGGGSGCPPCAPARRAARSKTVKTFADFLQRFLFKGFPMERISRARKPLRLRAPSSPQIGRASCRERV